MKDTTTVTSSRPGQGPPDSGRNPAGALWQFERRAHRSSEISSHALEKLRSESPLAPSTVADRCCRLRAAAVSVDAFSLGELLKLIRGKRFAAALELADTLLAAAAASSVETGQETPPPRRGDYRSRFLVKTGRRVALVQATEVGWIEACGDYATLHTARGEFLLRESLNALCLQLDPQRFVRIHRSVIVDLERVVELRARTNRDALIRLQDGTQLRASRTYIGALRARLDSGCTSSAPGTAARHNTRKCPPLATRRGG